MKKVYPQNIHLDINRKEAKHLLELINNSEEKMLISVKRELREGLSCEYEYEVKCKDCPRKYRIISHDPISNQEIKNWDGMCASCLEDWK